MRNEPIYSSQWNAKERKNEQANGSRPYVQIARTLEDLMKVTAIRSTVFLADQACPYEEEFDGNDLRDYPP